MDIPQKIAELRDRGFCVLREHLPEALIAACRDAFWPVLSAYLNDNRETPNRGPRRHFMPMPFEPPCYAPEFFFDPDVLGIVRGAMDDRVVADQWGCDIPLTGSTYQQFHVDYQRPLFPETPDLVLPFYMLNVSFGLTRIGPANGPLEIVPGTHRMRRVESFERLESGQIETERICLDLGDVLIRHPWALHRGTPNTTEVPRPLVTVRYVRRWYADDSREVRAIPAAVWESLSPDQRHIMRFPKGLLQKRDNIALI
jgi:Phytanoyl-CoA dioxygenase (PhyH)